ncbi:MAG: fibro-slime domain-containing protein [Lachnospiraceae bacterium]|nr:fibro-slime domain-containing protein [Lachnospiraceae bacterium]
MKKASAIFLSLSVLVTTITVPDFSAGYVMAEETEEIESVLLPITILDHRDDRLLFQYDLMDDLINVLDLDHPVFTELVGATSSGQGLVSDTLGPNGKPVYKQNVVEKVAEIVRDYIDSNPTIDIALFNRLATQIKNGGENAVLGSYQDSQTKFSDKTKNSSDITSCMDYAYYVLNNFWVDTNGDITMDTDSYDYIEMDKVNGLFEFTDEYPVTYDTENRVIYQTNREMQNNGFYPIDKATLGTDAFTTHTFNEPELEAYDYDDTGITHNYHFGMTSHCRFVYKEDEDLEFHFRGDDDVYLFINKKLVMDIGAAHETREGYLSLNDVAKSLGLKDGNIYTFDFFYMERHAWASDISIQTNIHFINGQAAPMIQMSKDGKDLNKGTTVHEEDELAVNYTAIANNDGLYEFTFIDNELGVHIGKTGTLDQETGSMSDTVFNIGSNAYVKDTLTATSYNTDGTVKETVSIAKEDLDDPVKVAAFCDALGELELNTDERIILSGIYRKARGDENHQIKSDLKVESTMIIAEENQGQAIIEAIREATYVVDTNVIVLDGKWRLISEQYKLPMKFQDVSIEGKVYYLDCPNTTSKFTGTGAYDMIGYGDTNINVPGEENIYNSQASIAVSQCSDTTLYASKAGQLTFTDKNTISAEDGISFDSESVFEVKYKVNYFLLKVTNGNNIKYVPVKVVVNPGSLNVIGFQMNGNKNAGGVSQYSPSFRTISKASKIMALGNDLYRVRRFGTIFGSADKITDSKTQMTLEYAQTFGEDERFDEDTIGYYEATADGVYDEWTSDNGDEKDYNYYALTLKHWYYSYASLTNHYTVRAYAIIETGSGETVVYGNDVYTVSMNEIAKDLYQNKKMSSIEAHEFLYDNILNPVKIGTGNNRAAIASALSKASGVTSKDSQMYTYVNQVYKDLNDYIHNTNTANTVEGKFYAYSTHNGFVSSLSEADQTTFLATLNGYSHTDYNSISEWIYNQVPVISGADYGFYKKVDYDWDLTMYDKDNN